jgi:transketolase
MPDPISVLEQKVHELNRAMLEMCIDAGKGHVTSSVSCMDILVAMYYGGVLKVNPDQPEWPGRDRFILSKGQASPALYTLLADKGFFDRQLLASFTRKGGAFSVHLQKTVPGVEVTAGSLGQAYCVGAGMALSMKMDQRNNMVFAVLGDGELYEGSIWETAMFAAHNQLNNLVTIIDRNAACTMDFTENMVALEPLHDKWKSFGFRVRRIDGHDMSAILEALDDVRSRRSRKPLVIIADTVKGNGIASMENDPSWHGLAPSGDAAVQALKDLEEGSAS